MNGEMIFYAWFFGVLIVFVIGNISIMTIDISKYREIRRKNKYLKCWIKQQTTSDVYSNACYGSVRAVTKNCIECPYYVESLRKETLNEKLR